MGSSIFQNSVRRRFCVVRKVKFYTLFIYLCCSNSFSLTLEKGNFFTQFHFALGVINQSKAIDAVSDLKKSEGVRYFEWSFTPYRFQTPQHFYLPPTTSVDPYNFPKILTTYHFLRPSTTFEDLYHFSLRHSVLFYVIVICLTCFISRTHDNISEQGKT